MFVNDGIMAKLLGCAEFKRTQLFKGKIVLLNVL